MEFVINSSPAILFNYLSTPSGLSEWFCDNVNIKGKNYVFIWDGEETEAEVLKKVNGKYVRFRWVDGEDDEYFQFEITRDELTNDIAVVITDWVDDDEIEESELLWESQVNDLKNSLGV